MVGVDDQGFRKSAAPPSRGEGLTTMKKRILGLGLGLAMSTVGVVALPTMASADTSTCYTGCSAPTSGVTPPAEPVVAPVSAPVEPTQAPASGGLPFTGADIESMAAVGAGALLVGGALVRRSRRHGRATA
jgi:hypothetical protein